MLTIFQLFIIIVCYNSILSIDNSENDNIKFRYYKGLLESEVIPKNIELSRDDSGFLLKTTEIINNNSPIFGIPKTHAINGCLFYPFRDKITEVINKFIIKNGFEKTKFLLNHYTIIYQILYYHQADYDQARDYYFKTKRYESEIFQFEPSLDVRNYIDIMFRSIPQSIYTFKDEDISLAKTFNFSSNYQRNVDIYEEVLHYALELEDKEARVIKKLI